MQVHEIIIFITLCILVCKSGDILDLLLYLIISMNFSPCLEKLGKVTLLSW